MFRSCCKEKHLAATDVENREQSGDLLEPGVVDEKSWMFFNSQSFSKIKIK